MDKKESSFRVDAHQHFWIYNEEEYKWIGESMLKLRRNFLPSHLNRVLIFVCRCKPDRPYKRLNGF